MEMKSLNIKKEELDLAGIAFPSCTLAQNLS